MSRLAAVVLALLLGLGVGAALGASPRATLAAFSDSAAATSGELTSGAIAKPTSPVGSRSLAGAVTLSWAATPAGTGTAGTYRVLRWSAPTGGTSVQACVTTAPTTTCSDAGAPLLATAYYSLVATVGAAWSKESDRVAVPVAGSSDTVAPALAVGFPTTGTSSSSSSFSTKVAAGCPAGGVACGSTSDNVATTAVTYRLERRSGTGPGASTVCWNGSAWASATCLLGQQSATLVGGTAWRVPGSPETAYPNTFGAAAFTLTVRAVDAAGNATTATSTFSTT